MLVDRISPASLLSWFVNTLLLNLVVAVFRRFPASMLRIVHKFHTFKENVQLLRKMIHDKFFLKENVKLLRKFITYLFNTGQFLGEISGQVNIYIYMVARGQLMGGRNWEQ